MVYPIIHRVLTIQGGAGSLQQHVEVCPMTRNQPQDGLVLLSNATSTHLLYPFMAYKVANQVSSKKHTTNINNIINIIIIIIIIINIIIIHLRLGLSSQQQVIQHPAQHISSSFSQAASPDQRAEFGVDFDHFVLSGREPWRPWRPWPPCPISLRGWRGMIRNDTIPDHSGISWG